LAEIARMDVSAFAGQANLTSAADPRPASERSKKIMRKRTVIGTLLTIVVALLLTGLPAVAADDVIVVTIDIKPCKDPNVLNVNAIGWLPVAIYGDWEAIDEATVKLEGVSALEFRYYVDDYSLPCSTQRRLSTRSAMLS
jgi:hypothetical protein